jgi:hypothetical protein
MNNLRCGENCYLSDRFQITTNKNIFKIADEINLIISSSRWKTLSQIEGVFTNNFKIGKNLKL